MFNSVVDFFVPIIFGSNDFLTMFWYRVRVCELLWVILDLNYSVLIE